MKPILYNIVLLSLFSITLFSCASTSKNTATISEETLKTRFVFKAQSATPANGGIINLSPGYEFKLTKDSLSTYLPYYGRAYTAPTDINSGGIRFISTHFNYNVIERKDNKGWDVDINPGDAGDVRQMYLTVSPDGYASLRVTSTNRQVISYNGYVTKEQ